MLPYMPSPCRECPWRRDVPVGKFTPARFQALAHTAYDLARKVFACHMSKDGGDVACAGYVLMQGAHNLAMRLARQPFEVSTDVKLFSNYREMAIANGVRPRDPCLVECRDDGQMR